MHEFLSEYYLYIKSLHLISVICWMAGLLYLPRIMVYHTGVEVGSQTSETFKIMERKLLKLIMNPAMIATWVFGFLMIMAAPDLFKMGWFHVKLTLVLIMSAFHGMSAGWVKRFAADNNTKSDKFFRYMNEIPTVLMIIIVILAIVKPF